MNQIALPPKLGDIIDEYEAKRAAIPAGLETFSQAVEDLKRLAHVGGEFGGYSLDVRRGNSASDIEMALLQSAWKRAYKYLRVDTIASAADKRRFEALFEKPPALTAEAIIETFGDFVRDPRATVLRGLAEVFCSLDPAYRSHSKVKVGVKGLPKRVILSGFGGYSEYGKDRLRDVINAIRALDLRGPIEYRDLADMVAYADAKDSAAEWSPNYRYHSNAKVRRFGEIWVNDASTSQAGEWREYQEGLIRSGWRKLVNPEPSLDLRLFQNGNGHLYFDKPTLLKINRALAEFYGDVLPDTPEENPKRKPSTELAKDLQFYPTPPGVADRMVSELFRHDGPVLEPSCGDGAILDALKRAGFDAFGIEWDATRAAAARAKGHSVLRANFLEQPPEARFSAVVMNPPFYGRHYQKHIEHALRFLLPRGQLFAVVPATARYDHDAFAGRWKQWIDLPVGSFTASGTNVNTCILQMRAE